ncbi:hypothetical protein MNBD_GAMMA24-259 [hydrothermal vent metagenome]|uniref:Uncharacterized protein n=1 Tax=hydrothermal vent metagenome TaxID=652676 RepID=A0A3B1BNX5_9ZZZZ
MKTVHELLGQGKLDKAISLCESQCQRYGDKYPEPWITLAAIHNKCGRNQQALSCLQMGIKKNPQSAELCTQAAILCQKAGKLDAARSYYMKSLENEANQPVVHFNLGITYLQEDNLLEAEKCFQQTVALNPEHAAAHANLAYALRMQKKFDRAQVHYDHALRLLPDNLEILFNRSINLSSSGKLAEAEESYRRVLKLNPQHAQAMNALGVVLSNQGRHAEAENIIRQALSLRSDDAKFYSNLGMILTRQGNMDQAIEKFEMALKLAPNDAGCHFKYALTLLLLGNFERGWEEYKWRLKVPGWQARITSSPLVDLSNIKGKTVFIYAEQGLGDSIQFIRYLRLLKELGAYVIFEPQPKLMELFSSYRYIDKLIEQGSAIPEFDFQAPLLNLPGLFGSNINSIPADIPYLYPPSQPDDPVIDACLPESSSAFRIGIVWAGSPSCLHDQIRSCPSTLFSELGHIPQVELYSLQKGVPSSDLKQLQDLCPVIDLATNFTNFTNTASAISRLDLVISVDTAMAHLAGALGCPVWLVVNTAVEWRWLLQREDSPWYPSMRLFCQQQSGDWTTPFKQMKKCLLEMPPIPDTVN